ncbi:unnamed protein product [Blepharisma stoltei]|uniref:SWIM-type domain-containing protein n=1 Tax=Blepharisma stoltei TaxID=1481888 RepID=A0AAU9KBS8_9CILI|nr:unnamed protein product [Blepharisma stoltei]
MECSCYKKFRCGIPYCHLLLIYEFVGDDLLYLIVSATAKRWLLPECIELSIEEIKDIWNAPDLKRNIIEANQDGIKLIKDN